MHFNIDEMFDNFDSPPTTIEVSSESGEEFVVEPGDVQALDERFRVGGPSADAMSAFVGAAAATLFPSSAVPYQNEETIDTAGSQIERQLMELVEEHQSNDSASPPSFIDTEFEESPKSPDEQETSGNMSVNSYGRPTAAVLPTPRGRGRGRGSVTRPVPTYPPGYSPRMSNSNITGTGICKIQPASLGIENNLQWSRPITANPSVPLIGVPQQANVIPLMIQIPPNAPNFAVNHGGFQAQQQTPYGITVQTTHSTSFLLFPSREGEAYRLSPTVMPSIAGFCIWCGKTYNQIGLEILGEYLLTTAYDSETVRDRNVKSRAFIDGFEAALFTFKNAGLSQPRSCVGPGVQQ